MLSQKVQFAQYQRSIPKPSSTWRTHSRLNSLKMIGHGQTLDLAVQMDGIQEYLKLPRIRQCQTH